MNLVLDIGNTCAKIFLFKGNTVKLTRSYTKLRVEDLKNIFADYPVESSIISSVVNDDASVRSFLKKNSSLVEFNSSLPLPIKIKYKTPQTLGNDRIANAVGAAKMFPTKNVLVIDAGTCIKYDFVNAKGEYLGGSISPGVNMRFKALHDYTQKLPLVIPRKSIKSFIGSTTQESILTGVHQGAINEVNGFIEIYQKKYSSVKVILTGGDANIFARALNFPIFAAPKLTAIGLHEILLHNLPKR